MSDKWFERFMSAAMVVGVWIVMICGLLCMSRCTYGYVSGSTGFVDGPVQRLK